MVSPFKVNPMALPAHLIEKLNESDLPFVDFMNLALYSPEFGYYCSSLEKIGQEGDFITAPELSPLFGYTIANQCQQLFKTLENPSILEFGAGSGQLALQILTRLEYLNELPQAYYILELSPHLRLRQQQLLKTKIPHLFSRLQWLDRWPEQPLKGLFIANEVLDAMPIHRFLQEEEDILESFVHLDSNHKLVEIFKPSTNQRLLDYIKNRLCLDTFPYCSEVNLFIDGWIAQCAESLNEGLILLFDYGFPRQEYYHPDRNQGTLVCHYQHKVHINPLIHVGEQDITAHVDFTHVAEAAVDANLHVAGFTNQASFLVNNGLLNLLEEITDEKIKINANQAVKKLIEPHEMGELFKVIALSKGIHFDLNGFQYFDKRCRL